MDRENGAFVPVIPGPAPLNNVLIQLIEQLMRLPGIGRKTAQRLAFFILKMPDLEVQQIAHAMMNAKAQLICCPICNNLTDSPPCAICRNPKRDAQQILIVDEPSTLYLIEKTGQYKGRYHVLMGKVQPLFAPCRQETEQVTAQLVNRIQQEGIVEVIIATNPTTEGETIALHLRREIQPLGVRVTRIACGIPVGSDLEYADEVTLLRSLDGRREI